MQIPHITGKYFCYAIKYQMEKIQCYHNATLEVFKEIGDFGVIAKHQLLHFDLYR